MLPDVADARVIGAGLARARQQLNPDDEPAPLSDYEPCEVCGTWVVGAAHGARRGVFEPVGTSPTAAPGRDYVLRVKPHRCGGRA